MMCMGIGSVEANQSTVSKQVKQIKEITDCREMCSSRHGHSQMTRALEETRQEKRMATIEEYDRR